MSWVKDPDGDLWNLDFVESVQIKELETEGEQGETHGIFLGEGESLTGVFYGSETDCIERRRRIASKLHLVGEFTS